MKKLYKVLATASAFALVVASPNMAITSQAFGFDIDAKEDTSGDGYLSDEHAAELDAKYGFNSDSGSSDTGSQDTGNHDSGSQDTGNRDSGSSNSGNHDSGSSNSGYTQTGTAAGSGGSSYVKPNYTPGSQTSAGRQNFREVVNAGAGTYKVIHCGSEKMTFTLKDADGKAKAADSIALKTLDDGRWAINFTVKDATGCTIGAPLDRTYMYDTLGVSCVTINDMVIIDIAAESAAK